MTWVPGASMQALATQGLVSVSPMPVRPLSAWTSTTRLSWAEEFASTLYSGTRRMWQSMPVTFMESCPSHVEACLHDAGTGRFAGALHAAWLGPKSAWDGGRNVQRASPSGMPMHASCSEGPERRIRRQERRNCLPLEPREGNSLNEVLLGEEEDDDDRKHGKG